MFCKSFRGSHGNYPSYGRGQLTCGWGTYSYVNAKDHRGDRSIKGSRLTSKGHLHRPYGRQSCVELAVYTNCSRFSPSILMYVCSGEVVAWMNMCLHIMTLMVRGAVFSASWRWPTGSRKSSHCLSWVKYPVISSVGCLWIEWMCAKRRRVCSQLIVKATR